MCARSVEALTQDRAQAPESWGPAEGSHPHPRPRVLSMGAMGGGRVAADGQDGEVSRYPGSRGNSSYYRSSPVSITVIVSGYPRPRYCCYPRVCASYERPRLGCGPVPENVHYAVLTDQQRKKIEKREGEKKRTRLCPSGGFPSCDVVHSQNCEPQTPSLLSGCSLQSTQVLSTWSSLFGERPRRRSI